MSNKIKGNILEDLVAMMHEVPGVRVEKRRKLPVLRSKTKRKREIDVLITSSVAGYKAQIALRCKNEATALKTSAVDNFVGILNDVGIPIQQGILVSANGYTRDAQDAAEAHGLRTLVFEGLRSPPRRRTRRTTGRSSTPQKRSRARTRSGSTDGSRPRCHRRRASGRL
jgi:hypothetical protein